MTIRLASAFPRSRASCCERRPCATASVARRPSPAQAAAGAPEATDGTAMAAKDYRRGSASKTYVDRHAPVEAIVVLVVLLGWALIEGALFGEAIGTAAGWLG